MLFEPYNPYAKAPRKKHWMEIAEEEHMFFQYLQEMKNQQELINSQTTPVATPPSNGGVPFDYYSITPSFTQSVTVGNVPFSASFLNTSTGADRYVWDFGDGTTSEEENPTHLYRDRGTFTVTLRAINKWGYVKTLQSQSMQVNHSISARARLSANGGLNFLTLGDSSQLGYLYYNGTTGNQPLSITANYAPIKVDGRNIYMETSGTLTTTSESIMYHVFDFYTYYLGDTPNGTNFILELTSSQTAISESATQSAVMLSAYATSSTTTTAVYIGPSSSVLFTPISHSYGSSLYTVSQSAIGTSYNRYTIGTRLAITSSGPCRTDFWTLLRRV
jgi:PKD repeat protein